ncbi:pectin lyase fold/virulence factor [Dactylonectria macrodidyma]|uniref:pectate lyase n=1 Tax=Dactylonectria macrodidyma TaxID=307937 RepID=A0A9P9FFQ7_9HYPO|nr:pectin lyase fold/virulence factor [Dactylonectria macrodidyma]
MKFSSVFQLALVGLVSAAPTPTIEEGATNVLAKRASITETCTIGYATQNGGTKGGKGGSTTTVSTLAQFTKAATASGSSIIYVKGTISGATQVKVTSDKTIVGAAGAKLKGVGLYIKGVSNVIVRNLAIAEVLADNGDAINIQASTNVWVDHCDVSSNMKNGKDYYDGLIDVNHGSDYITISNTYIHDHYKASLVGHSDSNSSEDKGKLHVTYANNYWYNVNSRAPSVRFGTVHIYNNYYQKIGATGVNSRMGAAVLVESTTFVDSSSADALTSVDSKTTGTITVSDVSLGGATNNAPAGSFKSSSIPYSYTKYGSGSVKSKVVGTAGQTLSL